MFWWHFFPFALWKIQTTSKFIWKDMPFKPLLEQYIFIWLIIIVCLILSGTIDKSRYAFYGPLTLVAESIECAPQLSQLEEGSCLERYFP